MEKRTCQYCKEEFEIEKSSIRKTCCKEHGYLCKQECKKPHPALICQYSGCDLPNKEFPWPGYFRETCRKEHAIFLTRERNIKKYGVPNPMQKENIKDLFRHTRSKEIVDKMSASWKGKTREEIDQIVQKRENTCREKLQVSNPFKSEQIKEKIRCKNLSNLGVMYPTQSQKVLDTRHKNNMDKYSVAEVMQLKEFQEKAKQGSINKYGVDNPSKAQSVINKIIKTNNERYGANSKTQAKIEKRLRDLFNLKDFLIDLYENQKLPIIEISKRYKVGQGFVANKLDMFAIPRDNYNSSLEVDLCEFLTSLNVKFIRNFRGIFNDKRKEIDVYLPDYKIGFEMNGVYHHSDAIKKNIKYHLEKTIEAEINGVHLIHIFGDSWIFKNEIVKNRILQLLHLTFPQTIIYARKCEIKELSNKESRDFLNTYHLYGPGGMATIKRLGLIYKEEIVAVMTFCKPRPKFVGKAYEEGTYELSRFAVKGSVTGAASKLFSCFIKNLPIKRIISYADRCWTTDIKPNLYTTLGFKKIGETKPDYWYVIGECREHRTLWQKSAQAKKLGVFDPEKTERENMIINGYKNIIWDCGSFKYEWTPNKDVL